MELLNEGVFVRTACRLNIDNSRPGLSAARFLPTPTVTLPSPLMPTITMNTQCGGFALGTRHGLQFLIYTLQKCRAPRSN